MQLWFKHILPALPEILKSKIGNTYSASLVLQGASRWAAVECIRIECPYIPRKSARSIIKDLISNICENNNHRRVWVHFSEGQVRKLAGFCEEMEDKNDEDVDKDRYKFNLFRPRSRPGMGASLGALYSDSVSATLGGYVFVNGDKCMLTSEHFLEESQKLPCGDGSNTDDDDLTSPSRNDLKWMKNRLNQSVLDLASEIDSKVKNDIGDRHVPLAHLTNANILEKLEEIRNAKLLLEQVSKQPKEYVIGRVAFRSIESRPAVLPNSLLQLENPQQNFRYHMDWALCQLTSQPAKGDENRRRYRSINDAKADDYLEEKDRAGPSGDPCYHTCSAEAGIDVCYVGQRSMHRNGTVNVPCLVSRGSVETLEWVILDIDGRNPPYSDVAGDSGAWVIKQSDNNVMGQVHSHSSHGIHFTPIDPILEDVKRLCGSDVSLPTRPSGSAPNADISQLCSISPIHPNKPLKVFKSKQAIKIHLSIDESLISYCRSVSQRQTKDANSQKISPPPPTSTLPSLTNSPQSPSSIMGSPKSCSSLDCSSCSDRINEVKIPRSSPEPTDGSALLQAPSWSLNDEDNEFEPSNSISKPGPHSSHFQLTSGSRTSTWPPFFTRTIRAYLVHQSGMRLEVI